MQRSSTPKEGERKRFAEPNVQRLPRAQGSKPKPDWVWLRVCVWAWTLLWVVVVQGVIQLRVVATRHTHLRRRAHRHRRMAQTAHIDMSGQIIHTSQANPMTMTMAIADTVTHTTHTVRRHARDSHVVSVVGGALVEVIEAFVLVDVVFDRHAAVRVRFVRAAVLGEVVGAREGFAAEAADVGPFLRVGADVSVWCQYGV